MGPMNGYSYETIQTTDEALAEARREKAALEEKYRNVCDTVFHPIRCALGYGESVRFTAVGEAAVARVAGFGRLATENWDLKQELARRPAITVTTCDTRIEAENSKLQDEVKKLKLSAAVDGEDLRQTKRNRDGWKRAAGYWQERAEKAEAAIKVTPFPDPFPRVRVKVEHAPPLGLDQAVCGAEDAAKYLKGLRGDGK